jgi:hypothetical protein
MRKVTLLAAMLLASVACGAGPSPSAGGTDPSPSAEDDPRYRVSITVLDEEGEGPELCLGGVADSLPPQCDGPTLEGWSWDKVEGEETASGTTWGDFEVTGHYDGKTFTVLAAGPPNYPDHEDPPIETPCPEPSGGWTSTDPSLTSQSDLDKAIRTARGEPDLAGVWVDYIEEPTEYQPPSNTILTLAFTGDLESHEEEIRAIWGGPLCVTQLERSLHELTQLQKDFPAEELGLELLGSGIAENRNVLEIMVVVLPDEARAEVERRYGDSVLIEAILQPVP